MSRYVRILAVAMAILVTVQVVEAQAPGVGVMEWGPNIVWSGQDMWGAVKGYVTNPVYWAGGRWVACTLAPAAVAAICEVAVAAIAVGGVVLTAGCIAALSAYALEKGWEWVNNQFMKAGDNRIVVGTYNGEPVYLELSSPLKLTAGAPKGAMVFHENADGPGSYRAVIACYPSKQAIIASGAPCTSTGDMYTWGQPTPGWPHAHYGYCAGNTWDGGMYPIRIWPYAGKEGYMEPYDPSEGVVAVPPEELVVAITDDLVAGNQKAKDLAAALVGAVNPPWNDAKKTSAPPAAMPGLTGDRVTTIHDRLVGGISPGDRDRIIADDNPGNAVMPPVNNIPLSKAEVAEAVRDGVNQAAEGAGSIPVLEPEPNPELPEKKSLTAVLDWFYGAIGSLPIISALTDLDLETTGGSPTVQVTIGSLFGEGAKTYTLNFSQDSILGVNYGSMLGLLGNLLLAITGIRWMIYLFRAGD